MVLVVNIPKMLTTYKFCRQHTQLYILYFLFVINEVESLIKKDPYLLLFYFPLPELF